MNSRRLFAVLIIALCMIMSVVMLAGCGSGSGSKEQAAEEETEAVEEAAEEAEEAAEEAADPKEKFVGSWSLAAAEAEGVTMSGNFKELAGLTDEGMMKINEDGTGSLALGDDDDDKASLSWTMDGDDVMILKADKETDSTGKDIKVKYKDDALFMEMEGEDGNVGTAIFTHDGVYPEAPEISMDDAEEITSEDELLGKWNMSAMNMMGISIYGDAEALKKMGGGDETFIEFQKGGKVKLSTGDGSWKIENGGAVMTSTDVSGTYDYPVKKLGDDIVIDMGEILGGNTFIMVLSKAK